MSETADWITLLIVLAGFAHQAMMAPHQYDGTGLKSAPIAHATAAARHTTLKDALRRRQQRA